MLAEGGQLAAIGEVGARHHLGHLFHLGQQVDQEEGNPDALAFAAHADAAHAVVPVAASHQRQPMFADTAHGAVDGTTQVFVERSILEIGRLFVGSECHLVFRHRVADAAFGLAFGQMVAFAEGHRLGEYVVVASDGDVLVGDVDKPQVVVAEGGRHVQGFDDGHSRGRCRDSS